MEEDYYKYLNELFVKAFSKRPFDTICSLLRIGGGSDANWEPFEESRKAFDDYDWLLEKSKKERNISCSLRIGLLMYCQAVEMSTPHEILANILRCNNNLPYVYDPFEKMKVRKKYGLSYRPPSATSKFKELKRLALEAGDTNLNQIIDTFFDDKVRNAFSHSDYIITDSHFRYTEGQPATEIELKEIEKKINSCFNYYSSFMSLHRHWLLKLRKLKKYHKFPNYEVLELLSSEEEGLYGFNMHFSNGSKSTFKRRSSGVDSLNLFIEETGQLNFMVGYTDKLEPVWKINGQPVDDWDKINE